MTTTTLTKKEMLEAIKNIKNIKDEKTLKTLMRKNKEDLHKEMILCIKEDEATQTTTKPGGSKMKENFVIGARDCSQWKYGKKVKPAEATEAVEAVKGVKATAAVKANNKEGIEAVKAVAAVEGVKAQKAIPAKAATNGSIQMFFKAVSEEVAQEAVARMIQEGLTPDNADQDGNAVYFDDKLEIWFFSFTHELDRKLRDAFKAVKAKDGYNAPGLALLKEEAKKKAASEKKAAEPKEKEVKGNVKSGKNEPEDKEVSESGDDEWPA